MEEMINILGRDYLVGEEEIEKGPLGAGTNYPQG